MRGLIIILILFLKVNLFAQDTLSSKKLLIGIDLLRTVSHFSYFKNYIPLHINASVIGGKGWSIPLEGGVISSQNNLQLKGNHSIEQFATYLKGGFEKNLDSENSEIDNYFGVMPGFSMVNEIRAVHIKGDLYDDYTEIIYDEKLIYWITSVYAGTRVSLMHVYNLKNAFVEANFGLTFSSNQSYPNPKYFIPGIGRPYNHADFIVAPNISFSLLYAF